MKSATAGAPTHLRQRGVVLITAVLIMAVIAAVATTLALDQQVWLRQTENLNERAQAENLRYSALDWTAMLLTRDAKDNKVDSLDEPWAKQLPPLPAEGGLIIASIRDAQGLFNLNNLVRAGVASQPDIDVFMRLLTALNLDPTLADALVDWIDTDQLPRPAGAEDSYYVAQQPSYRCANQLLTSVDELRLIKGFTPKVVETLRPYVTVLPESNTAINVNTAVDLVLAALFPNVSSTTLQPILKNRETQPFKDLGQFIQQLNQIAPGAAPSTTPAINTHYFLVTINIRIGRLDSRSEALIARPDNQPARVLWHRLNPLQPVLAKKDEQT